MIKKDVNLKIEISNKNKDKLFLFFDLFDIKIIDDWIKIINKNKENNLSFYFNYIKKKNDNELNSLINDLKNNIKKINSIYDKKILEVNSFNDLIKNEEILNTLHEDFQDYCFRFDNSNQEKPDNQLIIRNGILHANFLELNINIHRCESVVRNNDNSACFIRFNSNEFEQELKIEDYFLFEPELDWGMLYLGYNTIGKNFYNCFFDNDINLIKQKKIKPQKKFSSEFLMNFKDLKKNSNIKLKFYKWWTDNNLTKYYPDINIKDFDFGFIPIGHLKYYILNQNKNYITDITNKDEWNQNVWNKFDTIINFEISKKIINPLRMK